MQRETVEEYLARGGKIQTIPFGQGAEHKKYQFTIRNNRPVHISEDNRFNYNEVDKDDSRAD